MRTHNSDYYERLVDTGDYEPSTSADECDDVALALPLRRTPWLRRADAVCLAVVGVVACYIAVWQPAVRTENPFLLPHVDAPEPHDANANDVALSTAAAATSTYKYMTYGDIGPQQRLDGYSVKATARGFEIDGRRTLLIGGSVHYARSSPGMWRDILLKAKHDGLNHVQMYVFWHLHEQERGIWDFRDAHNVTQFYALAAEIGLFLHVRFGPYVCAEWNNGGLPLWLNWVPNMRVRSSNALWQSEMKRFMSHMVGLARPFLAVNGGPIVLAQIENEFTADDPAYVAWCGALVEELETAIPWVMCNGNAATNTIRACNADDCVAFAVNQTRDRPDEPLVWTENEGWYQTWEPKPDDEEPDNDHRSATNVAYAVARWFAVGGAAQNYYMYHGGNNYGRSAAAGVTTMYADGVNLHADGLSNEPKRSHLRALHVALQRVNDVLLASPRQLLFPQPLVPSSDFALRRASSPRNDGPTTTTQSELLLRAFVYTNGDQEVAFLENAAAATTAGTRVQYANATYYLPPQTVVIVANHTRVLFNTSDVVASHDRTFERIYTPLVDETALKWMTWSELIDAQGVPRKSLTRSQPLEQLRVTRDTTDYLTYKTSFRLRRPSLTGSNNVTLTVTTCDANSLVVFLNHRFVGEQHFGFPGSNCSRELVFQLPVKTETETESESDTETETDVADATVQKHYRLTLVSVSLGISSLGHNHRKGITGAVTIRNTADKSSSTNGSHWTMLPGLVGEQLELFDPLWTHSVTWRPWPLPFDKRNDTPSHRHTRIKFPLMAWYTTQFVLPESARPTPRSIASQTQSDSDSDVDSPIEDVSSILLDCIGLTRGRAYVNGHDLGRYWLVRDASDAFVQRYYHVPTDWLFFDNATANIVVVFDELGGTVASVQLVLSTIVETPNDDDAATDRAATAAVAAAAGTSVVAAAVASVE